VLEVEDWCGNVAEINVAVVGSVGPEKELAASVKGTAETRRRKGFVLAVIDFR
jgi:hypothetical protein